MYPFLELINYASFIHFTCLINIYFLINYASFLSFGPNVTKVCVSNSEKKDILAIVEFHADCFRLSAKYILPETLTTHLEEFE